MFLEVEILIFAELGKCTIFFSGSELCIFPCFLSTPLLVFGKQKWGIWDKWELLTRLLFDPTAWLLITPASIESVEDCYCSTPLDIDSLSTNPAHWTLSTYALSTYHSTLRLTVLSLVMVCSYLVLLVCFHSQRIIIPPSFFTLLLWFPNSIV